MLLYWHTDFNTKITTDDFRMLCFQRLTYEYCPKHAHVAHITCAQIGMYTIVFVRILHKWQLSKIDARNGSTVDSELNYVWNVMAQAQKPDFVFRRNGRVHLNRRGRQSIRLLAAEVCASAVVMVVMLDTPCSKVVWRVLATHSIRQFPLHFPSRASPCTITFQLDCTTKCHFVSSPSAILSQ
jgi:hypothetical protein